MTVLQYGNQIYRENLELNNKRFCQQLLLELLLE